MAVTDFRRMNTHCVAFSVYGTAAGYLHCSYLDLDGRIYTAGLDDQFQFIDYI